MIGASAAGNGDAPIALEDRRRKIPINAVTATIAALTLVAAILRLYNLSAVPLNPFYDAAVRSMSQSWHNFFFAAFEPSGAVSVDKPPLELWLQVISTKIFGFNSLALKLPEALAGTLAVPLVFDFVRRMFGSGAGLASAAVLTVLPVSVITSRSDTMDSLMMMLLVLTAWLITLALQSRNWRYLLIAAAVIGLNFEVKLFEAILPVPALVLYYLAGSDAPVRRRIALTALAGAVALAAGLIWPVAISLAPSHERPYALGSSDGTIWNSMFVFDGLNRLGNGGNKASGHPSMSKKQAVMRIFQTHQRQIGEFFGATLLAALLFGLAALLLAGKTMLRGPPSDELRIRRAAFAMTVAWLVSVGGALSLSSRLHPRYLEAWTPAVVIALGVAVAWIARASVRRPWSAAAAIAVCVSGATYYVSRLHTTTSLTIDLMIFFALVSVFAAGVHAAAPIAMERRLSDGRWTVTIGVLTLIPLLISPIAVSHRLIAASYTDSNYGPTDITRSQGATLSTFFAANRGGARYQAIVRTPAQASVLIVHNGLPLLLLQNVGRAPLVSTARIASAVNAGEVRYALLGGHCSGLRSRPLCPPAARWVQTHGRLINRSIGLYSFGNAPTNSGIH